MDLTGTITYNGVTASGISGSADGAPWAGTIITRANLSEIETDAYFTRRAIQDGADAADVYLGARTLTIDAAITGTSRGDAFDRLRSFRYAFNPVIAYNADTANLGFLPFAFYEPTATISTWPTSTFPNGIPLQVYARPARPVAYEIVREQTAGSASLGFAIRASSILVMRDPRVYLQSEQSISITASTQTATYRGNFPTWPIITFSMSAAGSSAMLINVAGGTVQINLSTTTTGTYTFDYADRTITDSNGSLVTGLMSSSVTQDFRQVQSGSTFYVSSLTGISSITLAYREAFI